MHESIQKVIEKISTDGRYSPETYRLALSVFDTAICEACAVSQAQAGRWAATNVGYAISVFTKICGHGVAMVRAAPFSRWVRSDFNNWNFSSVAAHARAICEGYLLFNYLIEEVQSEEEVKARIKVIHLNDCTRRLELFSDLNEEAEVKKGEEIREILRAELLSN